MKAVLTSALLLGSVLLLGCESSVDPYAGTPEPFTLWGVMNSAADTQKVRVFTIDAEPGIDRPDGIDAVVTSTNLTTGETREWIRREVVYDSGATGQVFWAAFRAQEGDRYRLEVERSDGAASTAEVRIPPSVDVELNPSEASTTLPVRIMGEAPHLLGVGVRYESTNLPPALIWPHDRIYHPIVVHPVEVSYQEALKRFDGGWAFTILMQRDYELVRSEYEQNCLVTDGAPDISLRRVELHFVAADSAWYPPDGVFDPDVLVEPKALSNVENGFGFVGAGHAVRVRWTPPREIRDQLGYRQTRPCNFQASPSLSCTDPPIPCIGENAADIWEIYF
jgi:hypothetical protein